jgi:antitoxin component of RelBE/YafQ-DinJ toxin-antitoxin module
MEKKFKETIIQMRVTEKTKENIRRMADSMGVNMTVCLLTAFSMFEHDYGKYYEEKRN